MPNAASLIANYIEDYATGQYLYTVPMLAQLRKLDDQISRPVHMLPQLSRRYNQGRLVDAR